MGLAMKNDGLMGHEWDVSEMIVGFHGTIWENHGKMDQSYSNPKS